MSTNAIFFSYSRDNSEFVLNLAKELREAGAKVWLDQLDIKPGTRWDKSIETALGNAATLLVVLSTSSVASNNVMDEVSYALEEGKTVVPILLEECEIPFRLRRLQFADFTSSHSEGMATLRSALKTDAPIASTTTEKPKQPIQSAPVAPKVAEPKPVASKMGATKPVQSVAPSVASTKPSKSKKPIIYAAIALISVVAVYGIYTAFSGGTMDMMALCKADWEEMETAMADEKEINELAALRKHIELYAPCPHEDEAMDRISFLKALGSTETDSLLTEINEETSEKLDEEKEKNIIKPTTTNTGTTEPNNEIIKPPVVAEETGLNIKRVNFAGGNFVQTTPKLWLETNADGERIFRLLKRDVNAIYLGDGPDVRLTLDIRNSVIIYSDANSGPFNLYDITSTSNTQN